MAAIREIHAESDSTYGQSRMTPEPRARGFCVNHKRTETLMRAHGIVGVHKLAKVRTTIPAEDNPLMPDLVGRRFAPGAPDVAWVGDITSSRPGKAGSISRAGLISAYVAGSATRWPITCAPKSLLMHSRWLWPHEEAR